MTRLRSRLPLLAVLAALSAATLAGCSSAQHKPGPLTLSFLSYDHGTAERNLITAFQKANPDVKVTQVDVSAADVLTRLGAAQGATSTVDVAEIPWTQMYQAYQSVPIVPVQKIAGRSWRSESAGVDQAVLKATSYGGINAAMPYTMSVPTLLYNTKLFTAAGIKAPPATMDQLSADATAIVRHGAQGVYVDAAGPSDDVTQSLIDGNGGSIITQTGQITLDQPPAVQALQELGTLTHSGAQPGVTEPAAISSFESGRLGMLVVPSSSATAINAAVHGRFPVAAGGFPAFGTRPAAPTYAGSGLVIMTRDTTRQQAAWRLVQFLTSEQADTALTTALGTLPLRPDTVTNPKYLKNYFARHPLLLPAIHQLATISPYTFFRGPNAAQAIRVVQNDGVAPILLHGQAAAPVLHTTANSLRELVGE